MDKQACIKVQTRSSTAEGLYTFRMALLIIYDAMLEIPRASVYTGQAQLFQISGFHAETATSSPHAVSSGCNTYVLYKRTKEGNGGIKIITEKQRENRVRSEVVLHIRTRTSRLYVATYYYYYVWMATAELHLLENLNVIILWNLFLRLQMFRANGEVLWVLHATQR